MRRSQILDVGVQLVFHTLLVVSLYFLLASVEDRLVHLNKGLGIILAYVGAKMILSRWYHLPTVLSLSVIAGVLTVTVVWSLRTTRKLEARAS